MGKKYTTRVQWRENKRFGISFSGHFQFQKSQRRRKLANEPKLICSVREEGETRKNPKVKWKVYFQKVLQQLCIPNAAIVQRRGQRMIRIALINFDRSNLNGALGTKAYRGEFKRVRGVVLGDTSIVSNSFDTFCLKRRKEMPCWLAYVLLLIFFI